MFDSFAGSAYGFLIRYRQDLIQGASVSFNVPETRRANITWRIEEQTTERWSLGVRISSTCLVCVFGNVELSWIKYPCPCMGPSYWKQLLISKTCRTRYSCTLNRVKGQQRELRTKPTWTLNKTIACNITPAQAEIFIMALFRESSHCPLAAFVVVSLETRHLYERCGGV